MRDSHDQEEIPLNGGGTRNTYRGDGTFITLGSIYYTCAFYKAIVATSQISFSVWTPKRPLQSTMKNDSNGAHFRF